MDPAWSGNLEASIPAPVGWSQAPNGDTLRPVSSDRYVPKQKVMLCLEHLLSWARRSIQTFASSRGSQGEPILKMGSSGHSSTPFSPTLIQIRGQRTFGSHWLPGQTQRPYCPESALPRVNSPG